MKIEPTRGPAGIGTAGRATTAAPGFSVSESATPARASATGAAQAAASLDMVLALQAESRDPGKRGRQARRGAATLDALEGVARMLLGAGGSADALQTQREPSGDPGLDRVLEEIDVRAEVELAKLEIAGRRRA
jgi:hypothetical protein